MSGFILALDQGTTNTKALAIDGQGRIAARHSVPTPVRYPRPGWVEQSGAEIWSATVEAIEGCLAALPADARLAAVSVANQRESVLLVAAVDRRDDWALRHLAMPALGRPDRRDPQPRSRGDGGR